MKRIIIKITKYTMFLLGIVLFVGCLRLPVYADIWVDPMDSDDFIVSHADSCVRMYCTYITNGKGGYVKVYKTPEDKAVVTKVENGISSVYKYYYYEDEESGWCTYKDSSGNFVGWIRESDLILVYDFWAFKFKYEEEIHHGNYEEMEIREDFVYLYEYPGSPVPIEKANINSITCYYTYEDRENRLWVCGPTAWICIDNPTALPQELYPDGLPEMRGASDAAVRTNWTPFIIVASLVIGVAAVTGILLLFIYRKHKSKKNNSEEA